MTHLSTDVAVIGVGAAGSATLWQLAERGIPAIGFERFEPGHDNGSSHGESRIFRTAYLEGPGYVPLAQRAVALWRELQRVSGVSLMTPNGALMLGPRNSSVITATLKSIGVHGLLHELIDEDELRARYPAHRVAPGEVGIREDDGGFVRPETAIVAAVTRAERLGARVFRGTAVERIDVRAGGVRLVAGDMTCDARHAIVSVGTWLGKLLPDLHLPLRVTRQLPGWYPIERPELFRPDRFPVFIRDIGDHSRPGDIIASDSSFYGFPTLDGKTVKVAIHREGPTTDPDRLDRTVTRDELARVREYINLFLHGVSTEPVRTQVCMYTNTPDHDFLIGSPPGMPQLTILSACSGHGFKFAPVVGEIGADLATTGRTDHPIDFLSLERFLSAPATPRAMA
ncbi:MAG: N-methyl-L-tryptophan oxidase [Chloroflexota bacterium]